MLGRGQPISWFIFHATASSSRGRWPQHTGLSCDEVKAARQDNNELKYGLTPIRPDQRRSPLDRARDEHVARDRAEWHAGCGAVFRMGAIGHFRGRDARRKGSFKALCSLLLVQRFVRNRPSLAASCTVAPTALPSLVFGSCPAVPRMWTSDRPGNAPARSNV